MWRQWLRCGEETILGLGVVAVEEESLTVGLGTLGVGGEVALGVGTLAPVVEK